VNARALQATLLVVALAVPAVARAQDATIDLTAAGLNKVVGKLGNLSDAGSFQPAVRRSMKGFFMRCDLVGFVDCPLASLARTPLGRCQKVGGGSSYLPAADPLLWSWRVTSATFAINSGGMTFTATVVTQVGTQQTTTTRSVPATVSFDASGPRVRINVSSFTVPVQTGASGQTETITTADIGKLYSLSLPIPSQTMQVSLPSGAGKTLTARVIGVTPQYMANDLKLTVDVGF
jgi:hypothetical protein